jgi:hypothetical protein
MTAARAIVLVVAAACASAAQAETLREQVAATLDVTTLCQASPCPMGFNSPSGTGFDSLINRVCCGAWPMINTCVSNGGVLTGTFTCGTQIVQCGTLTSLPACTGTYPQCPKQSSVQAAQDYCTSKNGTFLNVDTIYTGCDLYTCFPDCVAGYADSEWGSCPASGNVNMPAVLLAVVGTLVAAML